MNDRVLVAVLTYNEGEKFKQLLDELARDCDYEVFVVDDGSTDHTPEILLRTSYAYIRHDRNRGVGAAIRTALHFARDHGYEIIVIMAGNGKMLPQEIDRLVQPIVSGDTDYVQGSRYLTGGASPNLPAFRRLAIRLLTFLINLLAGARATDITCGFRAYRLSLIELPNVHIDQEWLDRYEMEYYLHYKALESDFRISEVPITMKYPEARTNYSKIRPFVDWWSMLRPWLYLVLRLRK